MASKGFRLLARRRVFFVSIVIALGLVTFGLALSSKGYDGVDAAGGVDWKNMTPSDMTKLTLGFVYDGDEIDNTINSTQSFTITEDYFIAVQAHSTNEDAGWIVATDFDDPSSGPAWTTSYDIDHGNGVTWDSKTNQIVVTDGYTRFFFNADNGRFVKSINVSTPASGIAYDPTNDWYIQTSGDSARILTNNFVPIGSSFDAGHRLVNQDVAYYSGHIYRVAWGGCNYLRSNNRDADADFCSDNFGNNSDVIYQFDMNGNFEKAYYIEAGFGELEGIDFRDGIMYLLFNGKPQYDQYSVYKALGQNFLTAQTVTFTNGSVNKTYGDANFVNEATTNGGGAITYSSNNTQVATVNSTTGEVTIRGAGTATITATAAATSDYTAGTATYSLVIGKATSSRPTVFDNHFDGIVGEKLSSILFEIPGVFWVDADTEILFGENEYPVTYTENNDVDNYTTETFSVIVVGHNVEPGPGPVTPDDSDQDSDNSRDEEDGDPTDSEMLAVPNTGDNNDTIGSGNVIFGISPIGVIMLVILGYKCFNKSKHRKFD